MPTSSTTPRRFSRDEFCLLIQSRLEQLEAHTEAKRRYASVLAAIRQNLDVYNRERPMM